MRLKTLQEVEAAGYTGESGPLYRIDTIVYDTCIEDDGATAILDAYYWFDERHGIWCHPFDCFFTDLDEARLWCKAFSPEMVRFTHGTGNGPEFESVAVDVVEMQWESCEWVPGYAVSTYDWLFAARYEEWHDEEVAQKGLELKV